MNSPSFVVWEARYRCRPLSTVQFAPGQTGNWIRGALGRILKTRYPESYEQVFAPSMPPHAGPSGLSDPPRPFVLRVSHLDAKTFHEGDVLDFGVNTFDASGAMLPLFERAFREMIDEGIGGRPAEWTGASVNRLEMSLSPSGIEIPKVEIRFLTPTEIKGDGQIIARPEFPMLFRRIRDRIGALRMLYGQGPLDVDFRALGESADGVRLAHADLTMVDVARRSGRTGQVHSIGGFTGTARYEGELSPFLPYLLAAQWTGVGRQTVWGKGEIQVSPIA